MVGTIDFAENFKIQNGKRNIKCKNYYRKKFKYQCIKLNLTQKMFKSKIKPLTYFFPLII